MRRFTPSLTPLGSRDCPAGSAVIAGHGLYISTDTRSETVVVRDDGCGRVSATLTGIDGVVSVSGSGVDRVFVHLRGGRDRLDYTVSGPPSHAITLVVDAGAGVDESIRVALPSAPAAGRVTLDFRGDLGKGEADVVVAAAGLKGVTVANRLSRGAVKVYAPAADITPVPTPPPARGGPPAR